MELRAGGWRMAGGGGNKLAMLAKEVANETADKLNGNVSALAVVTPFGTGDGTGEGDGDGDNESVRLVDDPADKLAAAAFRFISSIAKRP